MCAELTTLRVLISMSSASSDGRSWLNWAAWLLIVVVGGYAISTTAVIVKSAQLSEETVRVGGMSALSSPSKAAFAL